ncbi:MAG: FxsA family protein [Oceanicoccus sp.]|uniref:FxsA family protein n=1 Tax=Oceanicoccus sp. TaxID=2691044 RepID=UPI00260F0C59|nr:FxsA family protein [Oceanicoccus sp.]MCP3906715.1 FxsA family protein [Oceanicoccus sp.]MDG1772433.1 FxsA family protein [Oceanicoccus sp.]
MRLFLLLFITIPIIEMWVLIEVGSEIGALNTIFLVFLTAAIGLALLRQQGMNTLLRVNQQMEQGQLPAGDILEGVMLAVGGALLLTPGFITDAIGFACLLPFSRKLLVALLLRQGMVMASYGRNANFKSSFRSSESLGASKTRPGEQSGSVIEGEYKRDE